MSRVVLKRGNDQVVSLLGLHKTTDGAFLNNATVKASLYDSKGQPVAAFQNVPMTYKTASDGDYEWTVEGKQMMLQKGQEYSLVLTAEEAGLDYRRVDPVSVVD